MQGVSLNDHPSEVKSSNEATAALSATSEDLTAVEDGCLALRQRFSCNIKMFGAPQVKNLLESGLTHFHLARGSGYYGHGSGLASQEVRHDFHILPMSIWPRVAQGVWILSTMPTVDWVLLGSGESNKGHECGSLYLRLVCRCTWFNFGRQRSGISMTTQPLEINMSSES